MQSVAREPTLRCFLDCLWSRQRRLQVGPHDVRHSAGLGGAIQVVDGYFFLSQAIAECFQRHVDSDRVAIGEAIHHGPRRIGHFNHDPFDIVSNDAADKIGAGKADDAQRRIFDFRNSRLPVDGEPDFMRELSSEVVKLKRRKEADNSVWDPPGGFCQTVILRDIGPRKNIQTSGRPLQYPIGDETRKVDARNGILFKIGGAEYAPKAN